MRVVHSSPTLKAAYSSVARSEKHDGIHGTVSPSAISSKPKRAGDEFLRHAHVAEGGCFPQPHNAPDISALVSLWGLDHAQGPINGDQMAAAIEAGVGDKDGQAASGEFQMFADWASQHWPRLSPEARQVMDVYAKYARSAQAQGQSGIADSEFRKMTREMNAVRDASASRELLRLSMTPGLVGGRQMLDAIRRGVGDLDGKSATDEYQLFADWAKANKGKLTLAAKEMLGIYEKYAKAAQAHGQSGIALTDYRQMLREMIQATRPPMAFLARSIAG